MKPHSLDAELRLIKLFLRKDRPYSVSTGFASFRGNVFTDTKNNVSAYMLDSEFGAKALFVEAPSSELLERLRDSVMAWDPSVRTFDVELPETTSDYPAEKRITEGLFRQLGRAFNSPQSAIEEGGASIRCLHDAFAFMQRTASGKLTPAFDTGVFDKALHLIDSLDNINANFIPCRAVSSELPLEGQGGYLDALHTWRLEAHVVLQELHAALHEYIEKRRQHHEAALAEVFPEAARLVETARGVYPTAVVHSVVCNVLVGMYSTRLTEQYRSIFSEASTILTTHPDGSSETAPCLLLYRCEGETRLLVNLGTQCFSLTRIRELVNWWANSTDMTFESERYKAHRTFDGFEVTGECWNAFVDATRAGQLKLLFDGYSDVKLKRLVKHACVRVARMAVECTKRRKDTPPCSPQQ